MSVADQPGKTSERLKMRKAPNADMGGRRRRKKRDRSIPCGLCKRIKPTDQFPKAKGKARGRGGKHGLTICNRCIALTPKHKLEEMRREMEPSRHLRVRQEESPFIAGSSVTMIFGDNTGR